MKRELATIATLPGSLSRPEARRTMGHPSSPLASLGVLLPAIAGRRRGFTLLEVLLAIALTMVIAGTAMALASTLLTRRTQIDDAAARDRGIAILMDQVEQDLMGVVAGTKGEVGFVGSEREMTLRVRGVTLRHEDLIEARYRFVTGGEGALKPGRVVAKRGASGMEETLADGVALLRLRYHDGVSWVDSFDSGSKGTLPWAVEVAVWFGDPAEFTNQDETFGAGDMARGEGSDGAEEPEASDAGSDSGGDSAGVIMREPDRVRVIVVTDGVGPMGEGGGGV